MYYYLFIYLLLLLLLLLLLAASIVGKSVGLYLVNTKPYCSN